MSFFPITSTTYLCHTTIFPIQYIVYMYKDLMFPYRSCTLSYFKLLTNNANTSLCKSSLLCSLTQILAITESSCDTFHNIFQISFFEPIESNVACPYVFMIICIIFIVTVSFPYTIYLHIISCLTSKLWAAWRQGLCHNYLCILSALKML